MKSLETLQAAKDLSLEVWRYLAKHPEIVHKIGLPRGLYQKIMELRCECPICEVLENCVECPLGGVLGGVSYWCLAAGHPFERWLHATTNKERQEAAEEIVRLIEAWEVLA